MFEPDFEIISNEPISRAFVERHVRTFRSACEFVQALPYRRNSNRDNLLTVFADEAGTCSTKHALLKRLIDEHRIPGFELTVGIFKMSGKNVPKVTTTLNRYKMEFIPEAHTYLRFGNQILDFTSTTPFDFMNDLMDELEIAPDEISDYKISYHKTYLEEWLAKTKNVPYSTSELWNIREECIKQLSS